MSQKFCDVTYSDKQSICEDADATAKMDRNSDSSDEPTAAEKKMKVDNEADGQDTEMTSVDVDVDTQPVVSTTEVSDSNGAAEAKSHNSPLDKVDTSSTGEDKTKVSDDTVSSNTTTTETRLEVVDSTTNEAQGPPPAPEEVEDFGEPINLKVVFNKQQLKICMPLKKTVGKVLDTFGNAWKLGCTQIICVEISGDLKLLIEKETKVAPALQKVVLKGMPKDESTLESLGVTTLTKIMVIGTTLSDVMSMTKPPDKETLVAEDLSMKKDATNWCSVTQHKKIVDKVYNFNSRHLICHLLLC